VEFVLIVNRHHLRAARLPGTAGAYLFRERLTHETARRFLLPFRGDPAAMAHLRAVLAEQGAVADPSRLQDEQVVDLVAWRVGEGLIGIADEPIERDPGLDAAQAEEAAGVAAAPPTPAPPRQLTWIEIQVVDDASDEPLNWVRMAVKLPNGEESFHTTNAEGLIRIDDIEPGSCDARCDLNNASRGDTLAFVAMGTSRVGRQAPPPQRQQKTYRIAEVAEHKVQTGQTLESVAAGANMSGDELAKFNFDTSESDQVDQHLRDVVGCTKSSEDGRCIFDSSDKPGILLVPTVWERRGLATAQRHVVRVRMLPQVHHVWVLEMEDLHFHHDSAVLLPDYESESPDPDIPAEKHVTSLSVIATALREAEQRPQRRMIITGHTDTTGSDQYNLGLSLQRAQSVMAVLMGDRDKWVDLCMARSKVEDYQLILKWMHRYFGWDTDPGLIDNINGSKTKAAVKEFQRRYNVEFNKSIAEDGIVGRQTWGAFFDVYTEELENLLDLTDEAGLNAMRAKVQWVDDSKKAVGCGENFPKENRGVDNWRSRVNRRVEILFFEPVALPPTTCHPAPGQCNAAVCRINDPRYFIPIVIPVPPHPGSAVGPLILTEPEAPEAPPQPEPMPTPEAAPAAGGGGGTPPPPGPPPAKVTMTTKLVIVRKPGSDPPRLPVTLKTDAPFDGTGKLTRSSDRIRFFRSAKGDDEIRFNDKDNVFDGASLTAGVQIFAEGVRPSSKMDDVELVLSLSGGTKKLKPAAKATLTSVELTLDICDPRIDSKKDPQPLPQPPEKAPTKDARDKIFLGRPIPLQDKDEPRLSERAKLIVQKVKPDGFKGTLVLEALDDKVTLFADERPKTGETALDKRQEIDPAKCPVTFFVEGTKPSAAPRDTGYRLGIKDVVEQGDRVNISVLHTEIVSNVEQKDFKRVAIVPEKKPRATKSKFVVAPLIVGLKYEVEMRPHVELATKLLKFRWFSESDKIKLKDRTKEVVKLTGASISSAENDVEMDVIITTDLGRLKRFHRLTVLKVEIDPIIHGDNLKHTDDINTIKNPSGIVILTGGDASDVKKVPKFEITRIEPALTYSDDDERITWWIIGKEASATGRDAYDGQADFLNDDKAKYGRKIQIFGKTKGDVLIQPYSGAYGYGMFRAHVVPIQKIKYRVNRIFTRAVPPAPPNPGIPERKPSSTHDDAKKHMKVVNIYLRPAGIEMVPDDSAEVADPAGNNKVGLPALDGKVVAVTRVSDGHFDVEVNDQALTFQASSSDSRSAIRINARNEIVSFAYIHSRPGSALATALLCPWNHAPQARVDPPRAYSTASYTLPDKGVPSSSLIPKTGMPGDTPVSQVKMLVLFADVSWKGTSPANRDIDLLWGVVVPNQNIDNSSSATGGDATILAYANTLAHEIGHVLGLGHRGDLSKGVPDGLVKPKDENLMHPDNPPPTAQNIDIIQVKAIRFSELMFRAP